MCRLLVLLIVGTQVNSFLPLVAAWPLFRCQDSPGSGISRQAPGSRARILDCFPPRQRHQLPRAWGNQGPDMQALRFPAFSSTPPQPVVQLYKLASAPGVAGSKILGDYKKPWATWPLTEVDLGDRHSLFRAEARMAHSFPLAPGGVAVVVGIAASCLCTDILRAPLGTRTKCWH